MSVKTAAWNHITHCHLKFLAEEWPCMTPAVSKQDITRRKAEKKWHRVAKWCEQSLLKLLQTQQIPNDYSSRNKRILVFLKLHRVRPGCVLGMVVKFLQCRLEMGWSGCVRIWHGIIHIWDEFTKLFVNVCSVFHCGFENHLVVWCTEAWTSYMLSLVFMPTKHCCFGVNVFRPYQWYVSCIKNHQATDLYLQDLWLDYLRSVHQTSMYCNSVWEGYEVSQEARLNWMKPIAVLRSWKEDVLAQRKMFPLMLNAQSML